MNDHDECKVHGQTTAALTVKLPYRWIIKTISDIQPEKRRRLPEETENRCVALSHIVHTGCINEEYSSPGYLFALRGRRLPPLLLAGSTSSSPASVHVLDVDDDVAVSTSPREYRVFIMGDCEAPASRDKRASAELLSVCYRERQVAARLKRVGPRGKGR